MQRPEAYLQKLIFGRSGPSRPPAVVWLKLDEIDGPMLGECFGLVCPFLVLFLDSYISDFSNSHRKALEFRWNSLFDLLRPCANEHLNAVFITYFALTNSIYAIEGHPAVCDFGQYFFNLGCRHFVPINSWVQPNSEKALNWQDAVDDSNLV